MLLLFSHIILIKLIFFITEKRQNSRLACFNILLFSFLFKRFNFHSTEIPDVNYLFTLSSDDFNGVTFKTTIFIANSIIYNNYTAILYLTKSYLSSLLITWDWSLNLFFFKNFHCHEKTQIKLLKLLCIYLTING